MENTFTRRRAAGLSLHRLHQLLGAREEFVQSSTVDLTESLIGIARGHEEIAVQHDAEELNGGPILEFIAEQEHTAPFQQGSMRRVASKAF